jgi:hypothetical protein
MKLNYVSKAIGEKGIICGTGSQFDGLECEIVGLEFVVEPTNKSRVKIDHFIVATRACVGASPAGIELKLAHWNVIQTQRFIDKAY